MNSGLPLTKPYDYFVQVLKDTVCRGHCGVKLSNRKNAAICRSRGLGKFGKRCVKHSPLPSGAYYACMYKMKTGQMKGRFCNSPLGGGNTLFCSVHSQWNEHKCSVNQADFQILQKDLNFRAYVFCVFSRGISAIFPNIPSDVMVLIKGFFDDHDQLADLKRISRPIEQVKIISLEDQLESKEKELRVLREKEKQLQVLQELLSKVTQEPPAKKDQGKEGDYRP
tara:strand:- start:2722 stop:3393 length:672 start_codon:yes stop_codon:yes gene_type:complete